MKVLHSTLLCMVLVISGILAAGPAAAAESLNGQVLGGGAPIANSTVTLWAASAGEPKQLTQARTGADGRFAMTVPDSRSADAVLYLVAKGGQPTANKASGDNPAIVLMTVLGSKPPANVVINEFTTVASVWTHAQFLDGTAIKGHALGLRIAAGNVPNFVDLTTGGWGEADPGSAEQRPDADDGQLRHAGGRAGRLRHARVGRMRAPSCSRPPRRPKAARRPTR